MCEAELEKKLYLDHSVVKRHTVAYVLYISIVVAMILRRLDRIPADCTILAAVQRVEARHLICTQFEIIQLRVRMYAARSGALWQRNIAGKLQIPEQLGCNTA